MLAEGRGEALPNYNPSQRSASNHSAVESRGEQSWFPANTTRSTRSQRSTEPTPRQESLLLADQASHHAVGGLPIADSGRSDSCRGLRSAAKRSTRSADAGRATDRVGFPDGILASVWVLYAAAAATAVADPAREQKDEEDDDDDCEHVHLPSRIWIGLGMSAPTCWFSCGR